MFLRCTTRKKNGKEHRYWNLVENRRVAGGQVVQRQVLYLGEINDSQCEVLAQVDRGLRRWPQRSADRGALCRRANGADRRRASHSSPAQRLRSAQRSPMGWVLVSL